MIDGIFIWPLITSALYYVISRAKITEPLWTRLPIGVDYFFNCAACSGFWYGAICGLLGKLTNTPFVGSTAWWTIPVVALAAVVWTPIIANLHDRAMHELSGAEDGSNV